MKIILLLFTLLISASAIAATRTPVLKSRETKKTQPDHVLIISFDKLRSKTQAVSILRPVFTILYAVENVTQKLHGKTLKLTVTNVNQQTTNDSIALNQIHN